MEFAQIVKTYRTEQEATLRAFADSLSERAPQSVTHQTVKNWEDGRHIPSASYLLSLALHHNDWRRDFAFDGLAALKPDLYQPVTRIAHSNQQ